MRNRTWFVLTVLVGFLGLGSVLVRADVKPNPLFSDGMVLQRDRGVPVWGTADAGERVTVQFAGQSVSTTADDQGRWSVRLAPMMAGGPLGMTIAGKNTVELDDVLVGEVWIASGQSNMQWPLSRTDNSYAAMALEAVLSVPEPEDALGREALEVLRDWDLGTDPGNRSAALGVLSFRQRGGENPDPDKLLNKVREVAATLKEFHGRIDVEWQEVNRLQRGDLDVGLGGGPDILHCITGRSIDGGARTVGRHGDGHTMLVAWDKDGNVTSRSMHQYGTATLDESSPHYADQVPLIVERRTKPVWMDEADIRANLEREYRPGEE